MLCSDRLSNTNDLDRVSRELYSLLLRPFESRLDSHRGLVIETDASLTGVPFSALRDSTGHYVLERFTTSYSPSIAFQNTTKLPAGQRLLALRALIVAPSAPFDSSLNLLPLRDAVLEAQEVGKHFVEPKILLGNEATLAGFGKEIENSGVFHFAGHAVLMGDAIGLVFTPAANAPTASNAALLFSETIAKGNFRHLRLVVLAACSTVGSPQSDTMGRDNLVGEFLRAQVRDVIAMEWDVDSATTRMLMESFYLGLETDVSVPKAAQSAQLTLLSHPQTIHPFYWAAISAFQGN